MTYCLNIYIVLVLEHDRARKNIYIKYVFSTCTRTLTFLVIIFCQKHLHAGSCCPKEEGGPCEWDFVYVYIYIFICTRGAVKVPHLHAGSSCRPHRLLLLPPGSRAIIVRTVSCSIFVCVSNHSPFLFCTRSSLLLASHSSPKCIWIGQLLAGQSKYT